MLLKSGYKSILAGATTSLIAVVCAGDAQASESRPVISAIVSGFDDWQALDHCAAYGPDFASVAGSDACVRIGGRVRVEFDFRRLPNPYENETNWAASHPAAMHSGRSIEPSDDIPDAVEPSHVRLPGPGAPELSDPFH
jgi:Porin subfamily